MSEWTQRTIVVPDQFVALARQLAAGIAEGNSGAGMFTVGLSATGTGAPTHWVSAGLIWPEFAAMLEDADAIFAAAGEQVPLATIQAMLAASVVRADENPHAVLAELGLSIIQPAEDA